jgi:hypothetical protein
MGRGGANCSARRPAPCQTLPDGIDLCGPSSPEACLSRCSSRGQCVGGWCHCDPGELLPLLLCGGGGADSCPKLQLGESTAVVTEIPVASLPSAIMLPMGSMDPTCWPVRQAAPCRPGLRTAHCVVVVVVTMGRMQPLLAGSHTSFMLPCCRPLWCGLLPVAAGRQAQCAGWAGLPAQPPGPAGVRVPAATAVQHTVSTRTGGSPWPAAPGCGSDVMLRVCNAAPECAKCACFACCQYVVQKHAQQQQQQQQQGTMLT